MIDTLEELCCAPVTDDPVTASLLFVGGAAVAFGGTLVASHIGREKLRRKEAERECCR